MILKRVLMPMLLLGIIFGLSTAAQAQVATCSATATAATRATATGHTEPAGDLTVTCTSPGALTSVTTSVLQIDYGVTQTSTVVFPVGRPVALTACTGSFTCGGNTTLAPAQSGANGDYAAGRIFVTVPAASALAAGTSSFTVTGVLVSLAGTGKSSVSATISVATPGNQYAINGAADSATVITTVLAGIKDPTIGAVVGGVGGTAVWAANGVTFDSNFSVDITENYVDMFRESAQFNGGFTNPISPGADTQLKYTFANIPSGAFISGCSASAVKADLTASALAPVLSSSTVDVTNPTITVNFNGPADLSQIETVTLTCTGLNVGTATLPLTGGNITVQASLAPAGNALTSLGVPQTSAVAGQVPRYAANLQPATALTIVSIVPATTNLLIPFAVSGGGFDTGIAVSNTTGDPFGATTGGAATQNGTIVFTFFPNGGSSFSFTTGAAGTPTGNGGLTSGVLNAGNTYAVLLTQLLAAAGKPATFAGYVFITTNFTNAHGVGYVVSNFDGKFTSYTPLLVLPPPAAASRQTPAGGSETLGQ